MTQRTLARVSLVFLMFAAAAGTTSARQVSAPQLSQADRDAAVKHLQETRENFLKSIADLSDAQWKFKAAPDRWSIAEVAEHIAVSESTILGLITDKIMKAPPVAKDPAGPTDEKVIAAITARSQKAQAPEKLTPTLRYATREALPKDFMTSRDRTIDYVKTTAEDLRGHSAPHPALKTIDGYQWVLLLSAHSARHTAQIDEVKASAGYPGK
jgi:uncharacterized damage-inducible protein DinB